MHIVLTMAETTDILLLLGRLLFGGFFLASAFNHLTQGKHMIGYARSQGVPAPTLAVYGTGVLLLAGSLGVLLGVQVRIALALLALFLVGVTPAMHAFWKLEDPMARMGEQVNFMKNSALLGAALALLAVPTPWPWGIA